MSKLSLKRLIKDERGAIMITFAIMVNVLILAIALPMDLGRGYMASSAIAGAADAAAVASAVENGDAAKAEAYFKANLPNDTLGITYDYATDVTHNVNSGTVSVLTSGFDIPAFFSGGTTAGSGTVNVGGSTTVGLNSGNFLPADYFFIIDSSGSMGGSSGSGNTKAQAVGVAVNNFLNIVFANQGVGSNGVSNYRVSLTNYRHNYQNVQTHPLDDDKPSIIADLNQMLNASGGTCGGCGLRDSKDRLIEEINVNGNHDRQRIIIFMTDGQLNAVQSYVAPDIPGFDGNQFNGAFLMAAKECYAMKNLNSLDANGNPIAFPLRETVLQANSPLSVLNQQNVSVWTVRFGSGAGSSTAIMDYCASDPTQSVYAQTGNDLDQIFSQIGVTTSRIRLLE